MFESLGKISELSLQEEKILDFWREKEIFRKSYQQREGSQRFVFYEGPPTTNGYPHAGHLIGRSMKDLIPRYKTMCGYYVPRKAGWDTHGLPVELEVEKMLGFSGKQDIENYGIDRFNQKCRESIWKYIKEWEKITERMGIWIDMDHPYITCDNDYIESLWWILKQLFNQDLLYQGYKVLPYCSRCGTSLSSHEVAQGYQDVVDPSIYILFQIQNRENAYFLVWTTTPWTLVANVALAVGKDLDYVEIQENNTGRHFILNYQRLKALFNPEDYTLIRKMKGEELIGLTYHPLMNFLTAQKGYQVYHGDFVSTEEGTGIVHIAPAFGEDDMKLAQLYGLPILHPVKADGTYDNSVPPWQGLWVKDADPLIIKYLQSTGQLYRQETHRHTYPFCWRCDTPLLYYAKGSWFIRSTAVKDILLENNQKVHWHPEHIQSGRFGNFLENVVDWALSRERYWGTPLNIWKCETCGHQDAIGSRQELIERANQDLDQIELHRPFVDAITLTCSQCGGEMKRTPEVLDCWFDSGAMFVAQIHYPFENEECFSSLFPADFICEAIDQTRGWFYSLHVLASILFQSPAFKNCLVTELGLDEKGQKMSKHVGNVVSPWELVSFYGADVLRWYVFSVSPPWVPKRFGKQTLGEVYSKFFTTFWNVFHFFVLYANADGFEPGLNLPPEFKRRNILDRWIISSYEKMIQQVRDGLDSYEVSRAAKTIENFVIEDLSNWYIRRSRRRFWKSEWDDDKRAAYYTLYEILSGLTKTVAPFIPFVAEMVYNSLHQSDLNRKESVHLENYPLSDPLRIDYDLLLSMEVARKITILGRSVRNKVNIKIRQPLSNAILVVPNPNEREGAKQFEDIIQEELNVKEVSWSATLPEEIGLILKPRFAVLGPKYGSKVKEVARALSQVDRQTALKLLEEGNIYISVLGEQVLIDRQEVDILLEPKGSISVESMEGYAVVLDTQLNEMLLREGYLRDLVHQIQLLRKEAGFEVEDRIRIGVNDRTNPVARKLIQENEQYIQNETLAYEILYENSLQNVFTSEFSFGDYTFNLTLER